MIVKWNNNIVDYKCNINVAFFFLNATNPSFFFMLVYVLKKKKKKRENMQHMTSGTHTINRSHQPCVDVTPPDPHHHTERVSNPGFRCGRQALQQGTAKATASSVNRLNSTFTGIHICYIDIPQWVLTRHLRTFFFCCFLWFSLSSLRFLPPGVGLTGSSRPSKVLLEFKALILKTEHKQTLQSVVMLDCIERILIDREDISHLG